jgi:hypothetical protein
LINDRGLVPGGGVEQVDKLSDAHGLPAVRFHPALFRMR